MRFEIDIQAVHDEPKVIFMLSRVISEPILKHARPISIKVFTKGKKDIYISKHATKSSMQRQRH